MICREVYYWCLPLAIKCHWDFERFWNFGWAAYDLDLRLPNGLRQVRSTGLIQSASNISRPLSKHDQPNIITTTITTIIYHHISSYSSFIHPPKKKRRKNTHITWTFLSPAAPRPGHRSSISAVRAAPVVAGGPERNRSPYPAARTEACRSRERRRVKRRRRSRPPRTRWGDQHGFIVDD